MRTLIFFLGLVMFGCQPSGTPDTPGKNTSSNSIELHDVTYEQLDAKISDLKGKVVLVDVWATFCGPCVKKFPSFVKLHEAYAKDGLVCVSVSTDEAESRSKALEFLREQKATFPNYRLSESNEKISKQLNEKYPTDAQPVMFVFNRKGDKVKQFESKAKLEEIEEFVKKLLAEQ